MPITPQQKHELIRRALGMRARAYAPYSHYSVGAALLSDSGAMYVGANVENASYPLSMCAERAAIFRAVAEGELSFLAIAVATENGGSPCGACRQVLSEFSPGMEVLVLNSEGDVVLETTVAELLPEAFRPEDLSPES